MLGIVLLWLAVYLSGMLLCKIGREKETSQLWIHLTGFFFLFLVQGALFTIAQLLHWSFEKSAYILLAILCVSTVLSVLICRKELIKKIGNLKMMLTKKEKKSLHLWLIGWLWLGIFLVLCTGMTVNRQDALLETMQTTLLTDTMNEYHPFTGQPMALGVIFSRKILTLPFWYAAVCRWTGFSPQDTVWVWGSFLTITFSLLAFSELAGLLTKRDTRKNWLFVVLLELLILSGDYFSGASGYRLLFYGYSGETIVGMAALPMVISILYRLCLPLLHSREDESLQKERIGLWAALLKLGLILGASLFLAPLLWGPVLLLLAIILFAICLCIIRLIKRILKS